jgi:Putative auto-transporter adhesin, head GIN domain
MLYKIFFIGLLMIASFSSQCQTNPFTGSNRIKTQEYDFSNFNKISIFEVDGTVEIEVGKPFSVQTKIKAKYAKILEVKQVDSALTIVFKYTKDNNKYIDKPKIKVKITCPSLDSLYKIGNTEMFVSVSNQYSFFMSNEGNGSSTLSGRVKQLSISNDGNGKTIAKDLVAEVVFVKSSGNGDVIINAKDTLKGERNGNGKIIQTGKAILTEVKR